ncbi:sigma-54 dependent transcriptional regulator [Hydrocarboniclastica marina]|uniref:Sigma-54-dependent Fis family transcriptional regulator n=1 Tax=Hydrocarboniclastica marina TaxID=2259620 RepID=A0A4P7XK84_9ALTE|nr:sigma-54 dependent transcriptional regulator [Hydrocarboniclastica marina]MAL98953.1 sigma-54-dependent Fis family transcriptional regulator [Alteromonadaceae bacterium]QCF26327.1 sigma-54-dependent Fis family transcriptional regulator [Hydrocarboniclastica marina]|tara:strand:- start:693 stop:2138 length:1446 start_codon:yes stop_codon:yes gene_type:complete
MAEENKILVLSEDSKRSHDLSIILDFLGEEAVVLDGASWRRDVLEHVESSDEVLAVVMDSESPSNARYMDELLEWDNSIPVLMLGDAPTELDGVEARNHVIANIHWPPNYNKFVDSLYRAQVFRQQYTRTQERGKQREVQLFRSLVGTSRAVQQVRHLMGQVADKEVSVLITGESGTGKEVVARNLHYHSPRREKPFVPVNCGAIPGELLESELFGHEKGAFTGAISTRVGRFELAEGGTLFLDEIGDMPLSMQVKILRVLQEKTYERVGSNRTLNADVRIVAATHKNLDSMISDGLFREDLFYRLNVFPIEMPALRERVEDLPLLINELISRMEKEKRGSIRLNSAAILSLCRHDWPGNVRELANLVERLAIMHPYGVIGVQELPKKFRYVDDLDEGRSFEDVGMPVMGAGLAGLDSPALLPVNGLDLKDYLGNLEKSLIQQALDESGGVVARAAEKLRIRRTTLVEKVRKYGLREDGEE